MPKKTSPKQLLDRLDSFPWEEWNTRLLNGLNQPYRDLVITTSVGAAKALGSILDETDPLLDRFMTKYLLERASQLNETSREAIASVIQRVFDGQIPGGSPQALTDVVLKEMRKTYTGYEKYRAARIARTESAIAYNHANVLGYSQAGVEKVEVLDGSDDSMCAEASGAEWTLRDALADPVAHPNCVRSFVPIVPKVKQSVDSYDAVLADEHLSVRCAIVTELILLRDDPCSDRELDDIEIEGNDA